MRAQPGYRVLGVDINAADTLQGQPRELHPASVTDSSTYQCA